MSDRRSPRGATWRRRGLGRAVIAFSLSLGVSFATPSIARAVFTDVTAASGLGAVSQFHGEDLSVTVFAGGVAAGDVDHDGFVDLCFTRGLSGPPALWRNRGDGTFEDVTATSGLGAPVGLFSSATFADVDGDGWLDLLLLCMLDTPPRLHRNAGDGTFLPATDGGLVLPGSSWSASFGDWDRDGDLDLFVSRWGRWAPTGTSAGLLWRNRGDGTFEDATLDAGLVPFASPAGLPQIDMSFTGNFADVDSDGWPDLLVAADYGGSRILRNRRDGSFERVVSGGVPNDENGMGGAIGDVDGDGDLDWFVSSIWDADGVAEGAWGVSGNRLYLNDGTGLLSDATEAAGVREGWWGWGATLADLDADGDLDLAHVNGYGYEPESVGFRADPTRVFLSNGDGSFVESSSALGAATTGNDRGIVAFDHDRDGDLDLLLSSNRDGPTLLRNDGPGGRSLTVRLRGSGASSEGIGARVRVVAGATGASQLRELRAGSNYVSQDPAEAFFGLGSAREAGRVEVSWPGGETTLLEHVSAGGIVVDQPSGDPACTGDATANPCITGTTSTTSRTECLVEWKVRSAEVQRDPFGRPSGRVACRQGDPACDAGGAPGACTFTVTLCTANRDPRLASCIAGDVASIEARSPRRTSRVPAERAARRRLDELLGPTGSLGIVPGVFRNATPDRCEEVRIEVPLSGGGTRTGRMTLEARAASGDGRTDADKLVLSCLPPP
ncbi:MAG: CRTAC1 family protein [Alphaproteobacteria bacterium]